VSDYIGPALRKTEAPLLRGQGQFVADCIPTDALHAVFLRADQASANIERIDVTAARAASGVVAVITAADLADAGVGPLAMSVLPHDDDAAPVNLPMPLLAGDRVRHVGEPLAMIIAETLVQALDARDLIEVDLNPVASDCCVAAKKHLGDPEAAHAAIAAARYQITTHISVPRVVAATLECRGCVAQPQTNGDLLVRSSSQNPFALRKGLADHFNWDQQTLRIIASHVGGSFGLKGFLSREEALVAWFARTQDRSIAWIGTRSEAFIGDHQGRGVTGTVTLGLDDDLRITGLHGVFQVDMGAYPHRRAFGLANNVAGMTGLYAVPVAAAEITGHLSARMPLAPYRGNGRPEATMAIEQALDAAARSVGCDPVELRRRNLIGPQAMPLTTVFGFPLDCGRFGDVLDAALILSDDAGVATRRAASAARGMLFGQGVAGCLELAAGPVGAPRPDHARVTLQADGQLTLAAGVMNVGQGHDIALMRMAADRLGLAAENISFTNGDTDATQNGRGIGASSGISVAGAAMHLALERLIAQGRRVTADRFYVTPDDIVFAGGVFTVAGGNESLTLAEVAATQPVGKWVFEATFAPTDGVFPNGVHCCEVEIDPETGDMKILRYAAAEDVGRVHNADLVAAQIQGGVAMGLAQVRGEGLHFDADDQVQTGSLMDYYLLRASDLPQIASRTVEVPTMRNPLGAKGVGEAGTVGATAALMSAIHDALAVRGVTHFDMPATPYRLWHALQGGAA
jgi:carbon-monoxide dehydrogenase large subunit